MVVTLLEVWGTVLQRTSCGPIERLWMYETGQRRGALLLKAQHAEAERIRITTGHWVSEMHAFYITGG